MFFVRINIGYIISLNIREGLKIGVIFHISFFFCFLASEWSDVENSNFFSSFF